MTVDALPEATSYFQRMRTMYGHDKRLMKSVDETERVMADPNSPMRRMMDRSLNPCEDCTGNCEVCGKRE